MSMNRGHLLYKHCVRIKHSDKVMVTVLGKIPACKDYAEPDSVSMQLSRMGNLMNGHWIE